MPLEASGSPLIYHFVFFYCFINLLAQFEKLYPQTRKNLTPEGQIERKNNKSETSRQKKNL